LKKAGSEGTREQEGRERGIGGWGTNGLAEMDDSPLRTIRDDYGRIAEGYANRYFGELESKPLDRKLLLRLAKDAGARGVICDMGCGPGQIARFLRDAGAQVFGLDLSPQMVEQARRRNPGIEFREGNMLALDLADGSLAGIAAFYAIVNLPGESLPVVFREMARVLAPGGLLLLAFHIGDEVLRPGEELGHPITMEFFLREPATIKQFLRDEGFSIEDVIERGPYAPDVEYQSRRAYIFARKPAAMSD
jgi:SAM-dependent methyltransferase